jgi:Flp pilus assembly protein TadD
MNLKLTVLLASSLLWCGCQSSGLAGKFSADQRKRALLDQVREETASRSDRPGLPEPTNVADTASGTASDGSRDPLRLGELELQQGRYLQAQQQFEQVLQQHPHHARAHHQMAVVSDKVGQYARAEYHYREALRVQPQNAAVLSDLGYSYWLQGRFEESEAQLLRARQADPDYQTAAANLGLLYATTGRQDAALAEFRQIGDEAQVQTIMQQIAAMPAPQAAPRSEPVQLATLPAADSSPTGRPELGSVNDATRELLNRMELARQQGETQRIERSAVSQAGWNSPPTTPPGHAPPAVSEIHPFHSGAASLTANGPRRIHDADLRQALAEIDHEGRRRPAAAPLIIGPPSQPAVDPSAGQRSGWGAPSGNLVTPGAMPTAAIQPAPPGQGAVFSQGTPSVSSPHAPPFGGYAIGANVSPPTNPVIELQPMLRAPASETSQVWPPPGTLRQPAAASSVGLTGPPSVPGALSPPYSTSGVQQASGSFDWSSPDPVAHALHQQHAGTTPSIELASGASSTQPPGVASGSLVPPSFGGAAHESPGTGPDSVAGSYEQARREAALLGLQAGPGTLFPYVQHTQRAFPGTDSRWNGAQYPEPQRQLPAGMSPAQLAPAFTSPQPANLTTGWNFQGQQLPNVPAQVRVHDQYGAAASASQQYHQQVDLARSREADAGPAYDQVRQQQAAQLNGLIQQTYGQSPQSPPYSVSAPPSQSVHSGAMGGQIVPWSERDGSPSTGMTVPRAQPPATTAASPSSQNGLGPSIQYPSIQRSDVPMELPANYGAAPQPGPSQVIHPEPYHHGGGPSSLPASYSSRPPLPRVSPSPGVMEGATRPTYEGPLIVPNRR